MPAVRVEMLPATGVWVDISDRLRTGSPVTIRRGRADRAGQSDPGQVTLVINNRDGILSPDNPMSPYYQQIGRNTPIRAWVQGPTPYLLLPNTAGTQATVASTSAMDVTGDLDVRVDVALDALPAQGADDTVDAEPYQPVETNLIARYDRAANQRSWRLIGLDDGGLNLTWSTDGVSAVQASSTEAVPYLAGQRAGLRATLDVDNGSGGWTVTFYTAPTLAGPWVRLGQPVIGVGTTSIHAPVGVPLNIGAMQPELARGAGRWYRAEVRSGIGGTLVAAPDFTAQTPGSTGFTDSADRTWLVEGDAEITDFYQRFYGYAESWPSEWGVGGHDVFVSLRAWGPLRPLRGTKPLQSTLRRRIPSYSPLAYWPMEEDAGTRRNRRASTPVDGATFMATSGLDWGADASLPGSAALPKITDGAYLNGRIPAPDTKIAPTSWAVEFVYFMPEALASTRSLFWVTSTGTVRLWQVLYGPPGSNDLTCRVIGVNADGTEVLNVLVGLGDDVLGTWVRQRLTLTQDSGNVDWELRWLKIGSSAGVVSDTYSGTIGRPTAFKSPESYHADIAGVSIGHVSAWAPSTNADLAYAFADHGFDGEAATDRMQRLAQEEQMPLSVHGVAAETQAMGPQPITDKLGVIEDAANADGGVLVELRASRGLHYLPRHLRLNRPVSLTIPYGRLRELRPTTDDQDVTNDVTVSAPGGSSARAALRSGRLSVKEPPDGIGPNYDTAIDVNVELDEQLEPIAWWELHQGTWTGQRYPTVQVLLHRQTTDVVQTFLDRIDLQSRVQATGLPEWLPPGPADMIVEGYDEVIAPHTWEVTANATPAQPWTVGEIAADDPADDAPTHFDTDGSELVVGVDADDTELLVLATDGPEWTTTAGPAPTAAAGDLPFTIQVGGEDMDVTSVEPLVWDTFTRSVTDGWGSTPSTVSLSWLLSGGAAADRDVTGTQGTVTLPDTTAIRFQYLNAGLIDSEILTAVTVPALATGGSLRAGIVMRISGASYYQLRVNFTTSGAVGLDVVNSGTVIEAVSATGQTYTAASKWWIHARITGQTITGAVWADGTPERGWQITETVTSGTIASGLPGLTAARASGNTNVSPVMAFDDFAVITPQRFGVTRSVNGITKSHSAGADVRLANPMIIAL